MKIIGLITLLASALFVTGCASVASPVGNGVILTSVDGPVTVTENVGSKKKGEACASNVLGLFATGDASIEKARRQGDVAKVSSVDHSSFSLLFLYSKFCTVVHGE